MKRASCQASKSLIQSYTELAASDDHVSSSIGKSMLHLLPLLDEVFGGRPVWGLTSHYELILLSTDDYRSDWLIGIIGNLGDGYRFRYRLPSADAPWNEAYVHGEAKNPEEAKLYARLCMERCGGWALT